MRQKIWNSTSSTWEYVDQSAVSVTGLVSSSTTAKITTGLTEPTSPSVGDLWIDTNDLPEELAPTSIVWKEVPSGLVNGGNITFTTAQPYIPGSLQGFINGVAQSGMINETGPGLGDFTITPAPLTGDDLSVQYQVYTTATGNADTVDGYHANATPTASNLLPLNASGKQPIAAFNWAEVPMAKMYRSGTITVSNTTGTSTVLALNGSEFQQGGVTTDIVNGRIYVSESGKYEITGHIELQNNTNFFAVIHRNGAWQQRMSFRGTPSGQVGYQSCDGTTVIAMAAGDYIDIRFENRTTATVIEYGNLIVKRVG